MRYGLPPATIVTAALAVLGLVGLAAFALEAPATQPGSATAGGGPLDFKVKDIDGHDVDLAQYKGKVVLLVNVASKCGYTPQYKGLEALYEKYKDQGLVVIGFPANNFKSQEPGTDEQIKEFCTSKYNVTFPMMSKISVKGDDKAPLYKFLTEAPTAGAYAGDIEWNFTKFVVDRDGKVVARFKSKVTPDSPELVGAVEKELSTKG